MEKSARRPKGGSCLRWGSAITAYGSDNSNFENPSIEKIPKHQMEKERKKDLDYPCENINPIGCIVFVYPLRRGGRFSALTVAAGVRALRKVSLQYTLPLITCNCRAKAYSKHLQ
jgi:hypothetical protein